MGNLVSQTTPVLYFLLKVVQVHKYYHSIDDLGVWDSLVLIKKEFVNITQIDSNQFLFFYNPLSTCTATRGQKQD